MLPVNAGSDLDIEIFAQTPNTYADSDSWMSEVGDVWLYLPLETDDGYPTRLVIFAGGAKVDFTLYPMEVLNERTRTRILPELYERGYQVLLDKDGLASQLPRPSSTPPSMKPPSEHEFTALVEEFWFEAYHVAKYLRRQDLWAAKFRDWGVKELLLKMIEWYEKALHGWDYDTWHLGVRMQEWVAPQVWQDLTEAFAHFDAPDSWRALEATMNLFRRLAKEASGRLGYRYPQEVDDHLSGYIATLRVE